MRKLICWLSLMGFVLGGGVASLGQNSANIPQQFPVTAITWNLANPPVAVASASVQLVGNPGPQTVYVWVVANYLLGNSGVAGPFTLQNAPNAFSGSNYAAVSWNPAAGATSYDVLMTYTSAAPTGACNCAVATGVVGSGQNITSNTLSAYTVVSADSNQYGITVTNEQYGSGLSAYTWRTANGSAICQLVSNGTLSCGGTSVGNVTGTFTTNRIPKGIGVHALGDSSVTDDGTNPVDSPHGVGTGSAGYITLNKENSPTVGTAAYTMTCLVPGTNTVQSCATTATGGALGVAVPGYLTAPGTTGKVSVCYVGPCPVKFDNQTAVGDWAVFSTITRGYLHDVGTTKLYGQPNILIDTANSGAGTNATITLATPDQIGNYVGGSVTATLPLTATPTSAVGGVNISSSLPYQNFPCRFSVGTGVFQNCTLGSGLSLDGSGVLSVSIGLLNSIAANTEIANTTAAPAAPTAVPLPAGGTNGCSGASDKVVYTAGTGWSCGTQSASGLTSVGLTMPADVFAVANSPLTSNGTLAVTKQSQASSTAFMGPPGTPYQVPQVKQAKHCASTTATTTLTCTFDSATSSANLIHVDTANLDNTSTITSVSDGTNTYTQLYNGTGGGPWIHYVGYAKNIAGGAVTITVTFNKNITNAKIVMGEISGLDTSSPYDAACDAPKGDVFNNFYHFSCNSNSGITTSNANDLLVNTALSDTNATVPHASLGFTINLNAGTTSPNSSGYMQTVALAGTVSNFQPANAYTTVTMGNITQEQVAYKAASSSSSAVPTFRALTAIDLPSNIPPVLTTAGLPLNNAHAVWGTCVLGTSCSVTLTSSAVFTSNTTYICTAQDLSSINATKVALSSGSAFVITGNGTDSIGYYCLGN